MKIFQIFQGFCHWDATRVHPTLESAAGLYAPDIRFVEAPDFVFEGFGFDDAQEGDARFIQPPLPEPNEWIAEATGKTYHWAYNTATGTFYIADENGNPIEPKTLDDAIEALKLLGIEQEEVEI